MAEIDYHIGEISVLWYRLIGPTERIAKPPHAYQQGLTREHPSHNKDQGIHPQPLSLPNSSKSSYHLPQLFTTLDIVQTI
jgi:hypothetical protein